MDTNIAVRHLRKRYGTSVAVDDLSFTVEPGMVTGFVGPNGAGKSTTMRIILGLDRPDAGQALIGGRPYRTLRAPLRHVGALLDATAPHPGRRAIDHLAWLARSNGLPRSRAAATLEQVGLTPAARRRVGGFSLGMRQRLGIAAALLGDPPVLMLDEPANGLDPEGIAWLRGLLRQLAAQGRAVFISSHLMGELEDTADHLVIVGRGKLVADTSVRDLLAGASGGRVRVRTDQRPEAVAALAGAGATVAVTGPAELVAENLPAQRVVAVLAAAGVDFSEVSAHRASLEQAYMDLTGNAVEFSAAALTKEAS